MLGKLDQSSTAAGTGPEVSPVAYPFVMSRDHRPALADERARVTACGARIQVEGGRAGGWAGGRVVSEAIS